MIKARRSKKCKVCGNPFRPQNSLQAVCFNLKCALEQGKRLAKKREKRKHRAKMASHRADKQRIKTRSQLLREAQAAFNRFCRLRDAGLGCVSCLRPRTWSGQWHASHYRSVGAHPEFRFDESNVHKACSICNNHLSGALSEYRKQLIHRIGKAELLRLEGPAALPKWTREQIVEIKKTYSRKARELEKLRGPGL